MSDEATADRIRQEMAQVRRDLSLNYGEAVDNARDLADWRYYVRNYPWAAVGVAVAVGYMVVPNRVELIRPDASELLKLARKNKLIGEPKPTAEPKSSVGAAVFNLLASMLVREGLAYVGQKFGQPTGQQTAKAEQRQEGPTPFPK